MLSDSVTRAGRMRRGMLGPMVRARLVVPLALSIAVSACSTMSSLSDKMFGGGPQPGQQGYVTGFLGGAIADEPRAALVGREVLASGGTAGDAAAAMGLALSVTLPSRAGLGGGGACIAYAPDRKSINAGVPEAILFEPRAPANGASAGGDRPAALPLMARGLYLLHARYGILPFEGLLVKAEQLARFGTPASRAFVRDLNLVSGPLFADPLARLVFSRNGVPLTEGQTMIQPELAGTLAQMRITGVGDLYQGVLARRIEDASRGAGGPLTITDLRGALPRLATPLTVPYRDDQVVFLPPPADGGLAAAAAFAVMARDPNDFGGAAARGLAAAARWRAGGINADDVLRASDLPPAALPPLPASTSFMALDRNGNAVACAVTLNNLFGTGRELTGLGFLPAASPASVPPPLLAAGLAWNENLHEFHAMASGSGQAGAPMAVAVGLLNALRTNTAMAQPVPDPGRANVAICSRYLPADSGSCTIATDPREAGLAAGGG